MPLSTESSLGLQFLFSFISLRLVCDFLEVLVLKNLLLIYLLLRVWVFYLHRGWKRESVPLGPEIHMVVTMWVLATAVSTLNY